MTRFRLTSKKGEATFTGTRDAAKAYARSLANTLRTEVVLTPIAAPKPRRVKRRKKRTSSTPKRRRRATARRSTVKRSTRRTTRRSASAKRRKGRR